MRIFDKRVKMPKNTIWLVPGLRVKRWLALSITGSVLAAIGATFIFKLEPLYYIVKTAKKGDLIITMGGGDIYKAAYMMREKFTEN